MSDVLLAIVVVVFAVLFAISLNGNVNEIPSLCSWNAIEKANEILSTCCQAMGIEASIIVSCPSCFNMDDVKFYVLKMLFDCLAKRCMNQSEFDENWGRAKLMVEAA